MPSGYFPVAGNYVWCCSQYSCCQNCFLWFPTHKEFFICDHALSKWLEIWKWDCSAFCFLTRNEWPRFVSIIISKEALLVALLSCVIHGINRKGLASLLCCVSVGIAVGSWSSIWSPSISCTCPDSDSCRVYGSISSSRGLVMTLHWIYFSFCLMKTVVFSSWAIGLWMTSMSPLVLKLKEPS